MKGLVELVSFGASLLGLQMAAFSLCVHMVFPLSMSVSKFPLIIRTGVILE